MAEYSSNIYNEQDSANTASPPDGAPAGTFPNQSEGIWRATLGATKRFWDRMNGTITTTGSAGAYVYTPSNTAFPTAYVSGEEYTFKANFTSVGGDTLNINTLGARPLVKAGGTGLTAIVAGDIQINQHVKVQVNTTYGGSGALQMLSPTATQFTGGQLSTALAFNTEASTTAGATTTLFALASNFVLLSGSATISAFDTAANGSFAFVRSAATCTLTYNAVSMILPGGTNVILNAGDCFLAESLGSGNTKIHYIIRNNIPLYADRTSQSITGGATCTIVALGTITSGTTTLNFGTGPVQSMTYNGSATLAMPSNQAGGIDLWVTNGGSVTALLAFSGATVKSSPGDALTTTSGNKFLISIRGNGTIYTYAVYALQ